MRHGHRRPMARSEGLLIERVGDETVAYDIETKAAHCLSPLASVVFECCDGRRDIEELAAASSERLGAPVTSSRVLDAVAQLDERRLLAIGKGGLSRRDMIRRTTMIGASAIASAPLITSIIAPTPAAAATPTCGEITCCPCTTGQGGQACCVHTTAFNCQCVSAGGDCSKQCKASGQPAPNEQTCREMFPPTGIPPGAPCPCSTAICD